MDSIDFTPLRSAFIGKRIAKILVFFLLFSGVTTGLAAGVDPRLGWLILIWIGIGAIALINAAVSYNKQVYSFREHAIYFQTGNLVTDRQTELRYRNITHVRLVKPFLEYKLFGTGRILIEAAGSSGTEVYMQSIPAPEQAYRRLQDVMASRDYFSLSYGNLLIREHPARIAVVLEVAGSIAGLVLAGLFLLGNIAGAAAAVLGVIPPGLAVAVGGGVLAVLAGYLYTTYQDLIRRTYYIYDDVVCYHNGFLTTQDAFIPIENLSDARVTQSFLDKLLDLREVVISCQGQGSEIVFKNLRHGEEVERTIDRLINQTSNAEPAAPEQTGQAGPGEEGDGGAAPPPSRAPVPAAEQRTYTMSLPRVLLPQLIIVPLIFFIPVLIVPPIYSLVTALRTRFQLTANGVASYYTFLTTKNVEFARDKITGVVIRRNLIDRALNTCSVTFWSIGSGSAVVFKHIPYETGMEARMQEAAGIARDEELSRITPQFGFGDMLKANLGGAAVGTVAVIASLVVAFWLPLVATVAAGILLVYIVSAFLLHRRYRRASLRLGEHSVTFRIGWLLQRQYITLYDNVKNISVVRYPWSSKGSVRFNIAGSQTGQSGSSQQIASHSFGVGYLQQSGGLDVLDDMLDTILHRRPSTEEYARLMEYSRPRDPVVYARSRPSLKNGLAGIIPLHILIVPLIVVLPVTIVVYTVWMRRISYVVEDYRVVIRSGVVYRRQTSVVFSRLDYIKSGQGFLNKVFKNGNLYLYTTGSTAAEMMLKNMPDYVYFHQVLKQQYDQ